MKFNRVTALLLSLTLAFSLAACGQGRVLCIFCILFFCRFLCGSGNQDRGAAAGRGKRDPFRKRCPVGEGVRFHGQKHD